MVFRTQDRTYLAVGDPFVALFIRPHIVLYGTGMDVHQEDALGMLKVWMRVWTCAIMMHWVGSRCGIPRIKLDWVRKWHQLFGISNVSCVMCLQEKGKEGEEGVPSNKSLSLFPCILVQVSDEGLKRQEMLVLVPA